jgi:hypothetical protein
MCLSEKQLIHPAYESVWVLFAYNSCVFVNLFMPTKGLRFFFSSTPNRFRSLRNFQADLPTPCFAFPLSSVMVAT